MRLTSGQIRAARGFLNWTAQRLADEARVALSTVVRAERAEGEPPIAAAQLTQIRAALEAAGIEFTDGGQPGVRVHRPPWPQLSAAAATWLMEWEARLAAYLAVAI